MRYLSVQIQPERASGIDMLALQLMLSALKARIDLVRSHAFDNGWDEGAYYNFTFGSERPAELWRLI